MLQKTRLIKTIAKKIKCIIYKGGVCLECGQSLVDIPWAAHFHHRNPKQKKFQLSKYLSGNYSLHYVLEELQKCDLLCSTCHTKLHYPTEAIILYSKEIQEEIERLDFTYKRFLDTNELEYITKIANEGKTLGEIYRETGRTVPTIRKYLPKLKFGNQRKIKITDAQLLLGLKKGKSLSAIAKQYKMAYKTVWKRSKKLH